MKSYIFIIFIAFSKTFSTDVNLSLLERDVQKISKGLASLVAKKKLVKGSNKLLNGVVDLTCDVSSCTQITQEEQNEINAAFNYFVQELDKLKMHRLKSDPSSGKMLADGIGGLVYHTFKLAVFKENIAFHVKNIVASLLKIISYALTESNPKEDDLDKIKQNLNSILNSKDIKSLKRSTLKADLNEEQISLKQAFSIILNSLVNIVLHPTKITKFSKDIVTAVIQVVNIVLSDGKIDSQDKENIQVALENLGKAKKA